MESSLKLVFLVFKKNIWLLSILEDVSKWIFLLELNLHTEFHQSAFELVENFVWWWCVVSKPKSSEEPGVTVDVVTDPGDIV